MVYEICDYNQTIRHDTVYISHYLFHYFLLTYHTTYPYNFSTFFSFSLHNWSQQYTITFKSTKMICSLYVSFSFFPCAYYVFVARWCVLFCGNINFFFRHYHRHLFVFFFLSLYSSRDTCVCIIYIYFMGYYSYYTTHTFWDRHPGLSHR